MGSIVCIITWMVIISSQTVQTNGLEVSHHKNQGHRYPDRHPHPTSLPDQSIGLSSSDRPVFEWKYEDFSECSVTCGEGEEVSEVTCRNTVTGQRVQEVNCDHQKKKQRFVRPCRMGNCQAVWIEGEWGPCSAVCGGGSSKRSIYCAEEVEKGVFQRTIDRLCQEVKPDSEQRCNTELCPRWYAGQWSKCSVSCGTGIQERSVVCRRTTTLDCLNEMKPMEKRACHQRQCDHNPVKKDIDGSRRSEKGTSLALEDQFSRQDRNILTREYNYRHMNQRHRTILGDPSNDPHRHIDVTPIPLPVTSSHGSDIDYEELIDSAGMPTFQMPTTVEEFSSGEETGDLEQRETLIHLTVGNREKDLEHYSVIQLEPLKELVLMAAQRALTVSLLPGTNLRVYCQSSVGHTVSVWMRNGVAISKNTLFIRSVYYDQVGTYTCLRGNQLLKLTVKVLQMDDVWANKMTRSEAIANFDKLRSQRNFSGTFWNLTSTKLLLNGIVSPDADMMNVGPLSYTVTSDWSECQCGFMTATQTRNVSCELITNTLAVEVDAMHCIRQNIKPVLTKKYCSKNCYQWSVGPWKQCSGEQCLSTGVGTRWRRVECILGNNTNVPFDNSKCESIRRPVNRESCLFEWCQPAWATMPWSECSVSCGYKGVKVRAVRCVWLSDVTRSAIEDSFCDEYDKPKNRKLCFNPPCSNSYCRDESIFCSNVPIFGLCKRNSYSRKCCHSCSTYQPNNFKIS